MDLCALLDVPTPGSQASAQGDYIFEQDTLVLGQARGYADVFKRDCVIFDRTRINICMLKSSTFTCNPATNESNVRERGLPLLWARVMFNHAMLVREDTRKVYPERRFIGYNTLDGRLMVVVFCVITEDHIHIISFRKANDREKRKFEGKSL